MAVLKTSKANVEIVDGDSVQEAAKELGVAFGCHKGVCGACVVEVLVGMENLTAKSAREDGFDMRSGDRMMCQCSITSGEVAIN